MMSRTLSYIFTVLLFASHAVLADSSSMKDPDPIPVSIINLIATPERYDGKLIQVAGWASIYRESHSLCLAEKVPSTLDCIWMDYDFLGIPSDPDNAKKARQQLMTAIQHKFIVVRGKYDANMRGHLDMWSGSIAKIQDIAVLVQGQGPQRVPIPSDVNK